MNSTLPPPSAAKPAGSLLALPGLMLRTSTVPASVPSVAQSSMPFVPSLAEKRTRAAMAASPVAAPALRFQGGT